MKSRQKDYLIWEIIAALKKLAALEVEVEVEEKGRDLLSIVTNKFKAALDKLYGVERGEEGE